MSSVSYPPPISQCYTLSLHDALPISTRGTLTSAKKSSLHDLLVSPRSLLVSPGSLLVSPMPGSGSFWFNPDRSEEHTSELQSPCNLVCRRLLDNKKGRYKIDRESKNK